MQSAATDDRIPPSRYDVRRLAAVDLARAFALIRLCNAEATLAEWRRFGANLARRAVGGGGVLGVLDARGYLHGLCTFMPLPMLGGGRGLRVANVVLLDLADGDGLVAELAGGLERLGAELECGSIGLELPVHFPSANFEDRFRSSLSESWRRRTRIYSPS